MIPQQQLYPLSRVMNTGKYPIIQQNIRRYQPNQRQILNTNQRHYQHFDQRQQYQHTNRTTQHPQINFQRTQPRPQRWQFLGRYCHSCGNCDHWSNRCMWRKQGHNIDATWLDKKGGSLARCGNC